MLGTRADGRRDCGEPVAAIDAQRGDYIDRHNQTATKREGQSLELNDFPLFLSSVSWFLGERMMKTRIVLIAAALLACSLSAQATVIYDLAADFSLANGNPNGVWTYGKYTGGINPETFVAYDTAGTLAGGTGAGLERWNTGSASDPCALYNPTSATILAPAWGNITFASGKFSLSPSSGPSTVRWTAPTDGLVDWSLTAMGIQEIFDPSSVHVYYNGTLAKSIWSAGYNVPSTISGDRLAVTAGDQFDIAISGDKLTQLDATVTYVPEPSTLLLVLSGVAGLLAYAWRERR
jgi:hypothetical protein